MGFKRVDELLHGDIVVERGAFHKVYKHKVTEVRIAACHPYKTHVTVDKRTQWCADSAAVWEIQ